MKSGIRGTIDPNSPRAADWQKVFLDSTVPLLSPVPVVGTKPDGTPAEFYRVAVSMLDEATRERVIEHVVSRFGLAPDEVRRDLANPIYGLPILAEDVTVSIDSRFL